MPPPGCAPCCAKWRAQQRMHLGQKGNISCVCSFRPPGCVYATYSFNAWCYSFNASVHLLLRTALPEQVDYEIKVQMVEIYNESLRDLLVQNPNASKPATLQVLSTQPSGCNVPGATQLRVDTAADVLRAMRLGARNRHSAETKMNERSSRSHQVGTIRRHAGHP